MTTQSFYNYIGNVYCCQAALAYSLSDSLQKGRCVVEDQWDNLFLMTSYIDMIEKYDLPHYETTIRKNYNCRVVSATLVGSNTQVTFSVYNLLDNVTVADSGVFQYNGDNYTGTVTSYTYSSGVTSIVFTVSGDQTSSISADDTATFIHFYTNTATEALEDDKNCLEPEEMQVLTAMLNRLCGTSYAVDYVETTENDTSLEEDNGNVSYGWTEMITGTSEDIYGVSFPTSSVGYICGTNGLIMKSTDAGVTWTSQTSGTTVTLRDIEFVSASVGVCVGDLDGATLVILRTQDGGTTWTAVSSNISANFNKIYMQDSLNIVLVGYYTLTSQGIVCSTKNGFNNIYQLYTGVDAQLNDVKMIDADNGYAVGDDGYMAVTSNGWLTKTDVTTGTTYNLQGMHIASENVIYLVGEDNAEATKSVMLKTVDGTSNWSTVTTGVTAATRLFDILNYGGRYLKIAGTQGAVDTTYDGGVTFSEDSGFSTESLYCGDVVSSTQMYVAGASGVLFKYGLLV